MIDIKNVIPVKDLVIVKLVNVDAIIEGLLATNHSDETAIAVRYGEVISIGPDALLPDHCKGLIKGDISIFTEYAGHYIPTTDSKNLYKVIRGYDIIGKHMDVKSIIDTVSAVPTGNRLLVEIIDITEQEDGIIIDNNNPTIADLTYGKILKVNTEINKLNLTVGHHVAFAPYVGTYVRQYESEDRKALKLIVEEDILFTL